MNNHEEHTGHVVPIVVYAAVFITLLVLTGLTVLAARYDLGEWSTIVAVGIAIVKATLVVLYFMHLRYSGRVTWVVVITGFFWLGIFLVLTLSDYFSRTWIPGF
jgi:cytochrome c oxidase subunit IV